MQQIRHFFAWWRGRGRGRGYTGATARRGLCQGKNLNPRPIHLSPDSRVLYNDGTMSNAQGKKMTIYGYARVSTNGQDLTSQEAELLAAGCAEVFKEKASGAKTDRAELAKAIRRLSPGDVLVVTRLDRLARSTRDLLNIFLAAIADRKAGFSSLKDTWADTTTPHGRLMLTVLGGLAEFERELTPGQARAASAPRTVA